MSEYIPRAGSTAFLVIEHLRAHGSTGELALAAAIDKDASDLQGLLGWPIKHGALSKALVGDEWVYSLGDGVPLAPPASPPDARDGPTARAPRKPKPLPARAGPASSIEPPTPAKMRFAIWSDGQLDIHRQVGELVEKLSLRIDETRELVRYLDRMAQVAA